MKISSIVRNAFLMTFLILSSSLFAQDKSTDLPFKNLHIYNPSREYQYDAIYQDENDENITREKILVQPTGQANKLQKKQALAKYTFNYSKEDSLKLAPNPINADDFTKKWNTIIWIREIEEGIIEDDDELWIHPFRNNQYTLTEIAPFPEVRLPLVAGSTWNSLMFIAKGWGTFKGKKTCKFEVVGKSTREYPFGILTDCWELKAVAQHNNVGESSINYFYHSDYGFVELNYSFFNGHKIKFVMERVNTQ